jgi:hypothetical protein
MARPLTNVRTLNKAIIKGAAWQLRPCGWIVPKRITHGISAVLGAALIFWSMPLGAQPLTNPALFGRGNDWLALIGILFFTVPLIWVLLSKVGFYLSSKTDKPSWRRLWRDYFVVGGSIAWIVLVIAFFVC